MTSQEEKQVKILIVDDEEVMRDSCNQVLKKSGYNVEVASNGEEALSKADNFQPDIALIDLKMPGIGGMEVLVKMKEKYPELFPIIITGYATVESAVEGMKKGAFDFLSKPFTPDDLRNVVARAVEKRDILREMEKLRREKKMMEESFITMVSHQMRSPLASIVQFTEILLGGYTGILNDKQREIILRIKERLEAMMRLINDWLNMAKMSRETLSSRFEDIDLLDLVDNIGKLLSSLAEKKGVTIKISHPQEFPKIRGDKQSLEQVFINLITNGIEYNRSGGSVTVSFADEGEYVRANVSDTGIGISKEHIPHLFREFYRIKRENGAKSEGTGLGLAIAKKVVEAHGGKISVDSTPGKGSTFTVHLPKKQNG